MRAGREKDVGNRAKIRWTLVLSLATIPFTAGIGGVLLYVGTTTSSLSDLQQALNEFKPALMIWRWTLIVLVALMWHPLVRWLSRTGRIAAENHETMLRLRWRVVAWMIVLEMVIAQKVMIRFIETVRGV